MLASGLAAALCGGLSSAAPGGAGSCTSRSPDHRTLLVELYVSDGCDGCAQAVGRLAELAAKRSPQDLLAIVLPLHQEGGVESDQVLATRDRVRREFRRARLGRPKPLQVPLFLLQGEPRQDWRSLGLEQRLDRLRAVRSGSRLTLTLQPAGSKPGLQVRIEAELESSGFPKGAALYLAPVWSGTGNARGLHHTLEWVGPFRVEHGRAFARSQRLTLPAGIQPVAFGAAAFLQDRSSSQVLQSVVRPPCRE